MTVSGILHYTEYFVFHSDRSREKIKSCVKLNLFTVLKNVLYSNAKELSQFYPNPQHQIYVNFSTVNL